MSDNDYSAPQGLRTRGTVLVFPGRGETQKSYRRFGARLAADAYQVHVLPAPSAEATLDGLAAQIAGAVNEETVRPLILVGSDTGAAALGALVARGDVDAQAVVLAALPGYGTREAGEWDDELDVRTHCPVHRGVLTGDADLRRGSLSDAVPAELLDAVYNSTADVPHLLLVGDADPYADRAALASAAKTLPRARLEVVRGGHHDVLNDLQHRSVAASLVTFLETLRDASSLVPIVTVETSAW